MEPIINNEEGINPQKVSTDEKARLLVQTEPGVPEENGMLQKLTRTPRYFDPPECGSWLSYNECGEDRYKRKKHKSKKKRKRCYICGDIGHEGKRCKQVNDCFICHKKGHLAMDCPKKNVEEDCTSKLCLACGNSGHDMFLCANGYDPKDLEAIECYICKKVGHLCCVESRAKGPTEASCYNCGLSGHFGSDCPKVNEVANDLQSLLLCSKCKERGHSERECIKSTSAKNVTDVGEAGAKAAKRKSRRSRRRKMKSAPTDNIFHSQPNTWRRPQIVGPYYGRPGSNVWSSPEAAVARSANPRPGALPSHQHINHHVVTQPLNSLELLIQFPHPVWNSQNGTQIPRLPNLQIEILIPQTGGQVPPNSSSFPTQLSHPNGN